MAINRLVKRGTINAYANTLFDAAYESGGQDAVLEVRNQAAELLGLIYADLELNIALSSPDYTPDQRYTIAKNVLAQCNAAFCEVVAVMARNGDMDLATRVYHTFEDIMRDKLNLCVVDVTTAVPLDDKLRDLIKQKTEADLGCNAMLNESIDRSILGGIIMSVNGMRIDASVISQLNKARHVLKQTDGGED